METEMEIVKFFLPRILIATLCGAIIGVERELKNKVAGLRTNILICVGSAIFAAGSFYLAKVYGANIADPTRMLSTIVTGVGFLGGGVIMKNNEDKITGITTASFIWVMSAIGILAGMGAMLAPIILTVGLVFVSLFFAKVEGYIKRQKQKYKNNHTDED
jgi:putative Mg2+ transporter-C (MgtC) family protein